MVVVVVIVVVVIVVSLLTKYCFTSLLKIPKLVQFLIEIGRLLKSFDALS